MLFAEKEKKEANELIGTLRGIKRSLLVNTGRLNETKLMRGEDKTEHELT